MKSTFQDVVFPSEKTSKSVNFPFNSDKDYFIRESQHELSEFQEQMSILTEHLNGKPNPVEEYFFNGHVMSYVGPCKYCGYESLSILDFAFFELNFNNSNSNSYFSSHSAQNLEDMIQNYF